MLSSVPPELLHLIIESTVPHTFHSTTYRNRQRTLCLLSLVSKHFQAIAQPLLLEIVWINTLETLDRYKTSTGDTGEGERHGGEDCKLRTVVFGSGNWNETRRLTQRALSEDILQSFSSVKSLTWDFGSVKLETSPSLSAFSDLTSLYLSWISFEPVEVPELPRLQSLTICDVRSSLMASLLDPSVVPSLKHFSLVGTFDDSVRQLKQTRFTDLLPQLETLNVGLSIWMNDGFTFLHSAAERVLVDGAVDDLVEYAIDVVQIVHLRIISTTSLRASSDTDDEAKLVVSDLEDLIFFIQSTPELSLRSLYLDSSLRPRSTLPHSIVEAMVKLIDACRERLTALVFECIPDDYRLDPWISPEFVERQKTRQSEVTSNLGFCEGSHEQG